MNDSTDNVTVVEDDLTANTDLFLRSPRNPISPKIPEKPITKVFPGILPHIST